MSKQPSKVTIYDIAREAGCSPMTVSRALNQEGNPHGHRARKLRYERIHRIAERLNYKPNHTARALSRQHTGHIGFCINHPAFHYYHPYNYYILSSLKARLLELGYQLGFYYFRPANDPDFAKFLQPPTCCDAIVFLGHNTSEEEVEVIRNSGIRALSLLKEIEGITSLTVNEYRGGQLAAEALHAKGHQRVGVLWRSLGAGRVKGFLNRAQALGMEVPEKANMLLPPFPPGAKSQNLLPTPVFNQIVADNFKELLDRQTGITAVYVTSDFVSFSVVNYMDSVGIRLGEDLSLVSYDNFEALGESPWGTPRLTSIDIPRLEMGSVAAELLVNNLNLKLGNAPSIKLEPSIAIRSSIKQVSQAIPG